MDREMENDGGDMGFLIVIEKANGNYSAYSPDVPGCVATGSTRADCAKSMQEALASHLAELHRDGEPIPRPVTTAEYVTV